MGGTILEGDWMANVTQREYFPRGPFLFSGLGQISANKTSPTP